MEKVRVALIGCGGRQNVHIGGFAELDNVEVVAVADPIEERRLAAAQKTGAQRVYKNHAELLDHESRDTLDAVCIAVEPTAHTDIEERVIDKNLPFLIEKPMTLDLDKADRIAKSIEEKKLVTCVGFQDRYLSLMEIIKEELPKHRKGCVVRGAWIGGIPGVWWWQKKKDCGGQLVEQNIHLADGLRWLFGEPLSVYAVSGRGIVRPGIDASPEYDTDDYSVCLFRFPDNVTATLTSACYNNKGVRGTSGLYITLQDMVLDYRLRNNLIISTPGKTVDIAREKFEHTNKLDKAFIDAVVANDPNGVRSPYSDGLKSLKMCFAAERSMATGEVVYFDK